MDTDNSPRSEVTDVQHLVVRAVQQSYDEWAAKHPTLASVIDRIELTQQAVESLRDTPGYRSAVAAFYRGESELEVLARLIELAQPVVNAILVD